MREIIFLTCFPSDGLSDCLERLDYSFTKSLLMKKSSFEKIVLLGFLENLDRLLGVRLHRPDIVLIITSAAVGPAAVRTVMIVRITMIMMIINIL